MSRDNDIAKHLPLSEATTYIMLMLVTPMHGYGVMQQVEELTDGVITIGPGTLYGAFSALEQEGLIKMVRKEKRRKFYMLTKEGMAVLRGQIDRLELMSRNGRQILEAMDTSRGTYERD